MCVSACSYVCFESQTGRDIETETKIDTQRVRERWRETHIERQADAHVRECAHT